MKNEHGFTLIELLVTLAVAGILLTIAVPNFRSTIQDSRLITQTNDMVGMFALARSKAVSLGGGTVVSVCPGTVSTTGTITCGSSWTAGWVVYSSTYTSATSSACSTGTKTSIRVYPALPSGTTISYAGSSSIVTFLSSGLLCNGTSSAGDFTFCDSRGTHYGRVVNLSATGSAKASTGAGATTTGTAITSC